MKENYIVTLTTEYGNKSPYSAVIKGVLLSNLPSINLIEFSNDVKSNDIISASYIIKTASLHYPPGTIHLIGVDMNPQAYKQFLIVKHNGMYFVGSDNGIFSLFNMHFIALGTNFSDS
jgi:S-adenosylmethionine hydrolase